MLSRNGARSLLRRRGLGSPSTARKTFSSGTPRYAAAEKQITTGTATQSSKTSGGTLGIAAVAGVLGWGVATITNSGDDSKISSLQVKLDAKPERYATLPEMERVSSKSAWALRDHDVNVE
jgi:hypothetical protein